MTTSNKTIVVTHRYQASAEPVFDAFLDEHKAGKFLFTTPGGKMMRVAIEPRVDGRLLFVERRNGEDVEHAGRYLAVERPRRLVFEFAVPRDSTLPMRVDIAIASEGDGCVLTLSQDLPEDVAERSQDGWHTVLTNLDQLLH